MSGGTFHWLCTRSPEELAPYTMGYRMLGKMADELRRRGALTAAFATDALAQKIERAFGSLRRDIEKLHDVWRAVEWACSCDGTEEKANAAITAFDGQYAKDPPTSLSAEQADTLLARMERHGVGDVADVELESIVEAIEYARVPPMFLPGRLVRRLLLERRAAAEQLAQAELRADMACIEVNPECSCAGCQRAREVNGDG